MSKQVFSTIPWYKKIWNRIDNIDRLKYGVFIFITASCFPIIGKGIMGDRIIETKDRWIRDEVKDLNKNEFTSLDIEVRPEPLRQTREIDRFRAEFARLLKEK